MHPIDNFDHESIQQADWVGTFLEALAEGFRKRHLKLQTEAESLALAPSELVDFALKINRQKDQTRLTIKISWRDTTLEKIRKSNFITIES